MPRELSLKAQRLFPSETLANAKAEITETEAKGENSHSMRFKSRKNNNFDFNSICQGKLLSFISFFYSSKSRQ
jgi:hypothetical protein